MKTGDRVTLTQLGREAGLVGKHGSENAVIVAIDGLSVKVLRDGYKTSGWFHRDFWRNKRSAPNADSSDRE